MRAAVLMLMVIAGTASANSSLVVGDGQIDGTKLRSYDLTWWQCGLQDDKWTTQNDLTERLVTIGDNLLRVQQSTHRRDGALAQSTMYFDRRSFAPLRLERRAIGEDGSELNKVEHALDTQGYRGRVFQGDESRDVEGLATSSMLNGGAMGLPLATLGFQREPLEFAASMINFDATYKVIATWAGKELFEFEGIEVEAWLIDVEWHHEELGDVYPGGPDASGGRYWVVHNPPTGFPYVLRYKTDTYAVEFLAGTCPDPAS